MLSWCHLTRWSDIGSWSALWDAGEKSADGNVIKGDVLSENTTGSYVHATHRLVTTVGIENMIVVETKDAVLVAHKDHVQDVKKIVDQLKSSKRHEQVNHREVYRPWGVYDSIDNGERYQVKRITVKPRRKAFCSNAPPSRRTLDCRWHGERHQWW